MNILRSLPFVAGAALAACHGDSGESASSPKHFHFNPKAPTVQQQTRGMVDAAIVGNSSLAVNVKFDLKDRPVLGQPVSIELALLPELAGGPATVEASGGDGLTLAASVAKASFPTIEAGQVYRHTVVVTPVASGVLVLVLSVTLQHDDVSESRAFSVPLIVDPSGPPPTAAE